MDSCAQVGTETCTVTQTQPGATPKETSKYQHVPPKILASTLAEPPPGGKRRGSVHKAPFTENDWSMLYPLLYAEFWLTLHIFSPLLLGISFGFAALAGWMGRSFIASCSSMFAVLCFMKLFDVYAVETRKREVQPGFYYRQTERNKHIILNCEILQEPYEPTWWLFTGDLLTLYPFAAFNASLPDINYVRRWFETDDGEYVALDWVFPEGGFNKEKPVLVILHGLNGGSREGYCMDLVERAVQQGYTVVVMIARGLMQTPIRNGKLFHGARISDVKKAVETISAGCEGAPVVGAGFSMGAIVLSNYVAQMGKDCPLKAAVSVAGCFRTDLNMHFSHSRLLWQPFLAYELKKNFLLPFYELFVEAGLDIEAIKKSPSVVEFDETLVCPYNGYKDVVDYYEDMSAGCRGRGENINTPMLFLQAWDDPIVDVDSTPVELARTNENVFFLVTKHGGHVGWPTGTNPNVDRWSYSSNVCLQFFDAVVHQKQSS
eukprot:comp5352_c0_seq1/m.1331 comp5352_c0_seq1/g.1331  ORF comp5352_c0_seq1/g.1331 comp5352_c0_seq1/m.1331 type:complete len:489 (-) comp5352_c0_seq1:92-1558(-)